MIESIDIFSIEARRAPGQKDIPQDVRKDYKSNVPQIEIGKSKRATIGFGFMVLYGSVGIIRMEGMMEYRGETKELKKTWEGAKQMPPDVASEVHEAIMEACIPEAVIVARDIGLPPPIPLPRIGTHKPASK